MRTFSEISSNYNCQFAPSVRPVCVVDVRVVGKGADDGPITVTMYDKQSQQSVQIGVRIIGIALLCTQGEGEKCQKNKQKLHFRSFGVVLVVSRRCEPNDVCDSIDRFAVFDIDSIR